MYVAVAVALCVMSFINKEDEDTDEAAAIRESLRRGVW